MGLEHVLPMVMAAAMVGTTEGGFKWTAELEELYGDPEDPTSKAYVPPGWTTVYLWRSPQLWFQMNADWMTKVFAIFAGLRLMDLTIVSYFGYTLYASYSSYTS